MRETISVTCQWSCSAPECKRMEQKRWTALMHAYYWILALFTSAISVLLISFSPSSYLGSFLIIVRADSTSLMAVKKFLKYSVMVLVSASLYPRSYDEKVEWIRSSRSRSWYPNLAAILLQMCPWNSLLAAVSQLVKLLFTREFI